jgi:hypothetical protein
MPEDLDKTLQEVSVSQPSSSLPSSFTTIISAGRFTATEVSDAYFTKQDGKIQRLVSEFDCQKDCESSNPCPETTRTNLLLGLEMAYRLHL